jgi:hypothetical protein
MSKQLARARMLLEKMPSPAPLSEDDRLAINYAKLACEYVYDRSKIESIVNGERDPSRVHVDGAIAILDKLLGPVKS